MTWIDQLRRLERAMEDIEDPRGIEGRDLRDRLRHLHAQQPTQSPTASANNQ